MPTEPCAARSAVAWTFRTPEAASRRHELPVSRGVRSRWGTRYFRDSDLECWGPFLPVGRVAGADPTREESDPGHQHLRLRGEYSYASGQVALAHSGVGRAR
jgi:hypothetical protein